MGAAGEKPVAFAATHWSLVERAGQATGEKRRASLEELLQRYLPALRAHLTIDKKLPIETADDLLQGFVADKVMVQNLIGLADRSKGKFRTFLLAALNRYVIDQLRKEGSIKRGGQAGKSSMESCQGELVSQEAEPGAQFDVVWARELVARALQLMVDECRGTGRDEIWEVFECRIMRPAFHGGEAMPYEELVGKFGLKTPLQAYNLLTTGKRMFSRCLREAVGDYAGNPEMADEEINELKSILAKVGA
jgi:DNA-directed RNA polymerase specialized sigma24 family protein